jgi:hypothetical protein
VKALINRRRNHTQLVVRDFAGDFATVPSNKSAWRQVNMQQLKEFLTMPQCHNIINFASHEQTSTVHASPPRKGRGFSLKPSGETTEVNDPRGEL